MSITLTTGTLVQVNGAVVENDTTGGCVSMVIDYLASTATFILRTGVIAAGNLNAGVYGPTITLTLNLTTGAWIATNQQTNASISGTIGAGALASFVAQLKNDRNVIETFSAGASGILPGTQVPWP